MQTILIVDDDQDILKPICAYLSQRATGLETVSATSGAECVDLLKTRSIDLVLSDLRMPDGDGIDVLAYISRHHASLPVIVMSAFIIPPEADDLVKFGNLRFIGKPAPMDQIFNSITEALRAPVEIGTFNGFSLAGILQLIEMEEKTCLLELRQDEARWGYFALVGGRMVRAACGETSGEDAALEMLTWMHPAIQIRSLPHSDRVEPELTCNLTELLMRSTRDLDERQVGQSSGRSPDTPSPSMDLTAFGRCPARDGADADAEELAGPNLFLPAETAPADAGDEKKPRRFRAIKRKPKRQAKAPPPLVQTAPPPPPPLADSTPPTSVAYQHDVEIEHPSPWPGIVVFLAVAGIMIGFQWRAEQFAAYETIYIWGRNFLVMVAVLTVVVDAYQSGIGFAALCVVFPPYMVVYAITRLTSYPQRGVFLAAVAVLATEAYFMPDYSLMLRAMEAASGFIDSVDGLIIRAGS